MLKSGDLVHSVDFGFGVVVRVFDDNPETKNLATTKFDKKLLKCMCDILKMHTVFNEQKHKFTIAKAHQQ
jgi:hypothetical protein